MNIAAGELEEGMERVSRVQLRPSNRRMRRAMCTVLKERGLRVGTRWT